MKTILSLLLTLLFAYHASAQCGVKCGVERWPVKTLTDTKVNLVKFRSKKKSITWLISREEPAEADKTDDARLIGIETMTFRVRGIVVGHVKEADKDFHVVISEENDSTKTMIIEFPSSECRDVCSSSYAAKINKARADYIAKVGTPTTKYKELTKRILIEVTGVGFWDGEHATPQHGVAPNNVELHPIIKIKVIRVY